MFVIILSSHPFDFMVSSGNWLINLPQLKQKNKVIYQFKCTLRDCISENNNIYVGLTSTTLSSRLTMYLFYTSSIVQHRQKHSSLKTEFWKILIENTAVLEQQNNKQKLQILEALHIRKKRPKLNWINFESRTIVLKSLLLLPLLIEPV